MISLSTFNNRVIFNPNCYNNACYNNYITIYVCDKCVLFNTVESKVLYYFVGWEDLR